MKYSHAHILTGLAVGLLSAAASGAGGAQIDVDDDIAVSTTWTADNTYNLVDQIYVLPGATLTIEPGTVIASTPTVNGSGSLAVTRGAKIIAQGTKDNPIIFTSSNDVATWDPDPSHPTGGDPRTGVWREAANEWGNLTIMGRAFVANTIDVESNVETCDADNISPMEGLIAAFPGDPNVIFGGGDDDDDSGTLEYVSIRYGGRVVGLGDELNGLSLGGVGRGTDINYVEIMNNVDDGIEIWGGTVNLKHFAIWNIGDDSLDVDQGWRGKAQFGLIVQGYSVDASQGSGVGDNMIEADGAERADAQPVTTVTLYNMTLIGQPAPGAGDHGIAYRDGARLQVRNSIIMDVGDKVLRNDHSDGEGSIGYGFNGTLSFMDTWTTPYDNVPAHMFDCDDPAAVYQAQSQGDPSIGQGFLNEVTDTVFFRNLNNAYSGTSTNQGADEVGMTISGGSNPAKGNVVIPGFDDVDAPVVSVTRGPAVVKGGHTMLPVIALDPRAANEAVTSEAMAPNDGFFTPVAYRGAFGPNENWLCTWTAADAYGMSVPPPGGCDAGACAGDIDGNNTVNVFDLLALLGAWGVNPGHPADLDGNGTVNVFDLLALLGNWGSCE